MSDHTLCDACRRVIAKDRQHVRLRVQVEITRYRKEGYPDRVLDICEPCDMTLALALHPVLPHLAGEIEPNVFEIAKGQLI